jgi:hypothetical protein
MPSHPRKPLPKGAPTDHSTPQLEALPPAYFFAPDLEREINGLESVASAKVLSTGSEIDEIHVVAPRDRAPKKVVRDIESLLLVRFGIRIDHRCISVVQLENFQTAHPPNLRPLISSVKQENNHVQVDLAVGDRLFVGRAELLSGQDQAAASARAVIHAIEQLLQTPGVLAVLKTQSVEMDQYRAILVLVRWIFAEQQEMLLGASLVHGDIPETAARATLDAVNRRLVRIHAAPRSDTIS